MSFRYEIRLSGEGGQGLVLAGKILDATNNTPGAPLDYTYTMIMFIALGVLGLIFAFMLKREDQKTSFGLELPSSGK